VPTYFHGTSERSAFALLSGAPLDATVARELSTTGATGAFYLATDIDDALYLASLKGERYAVLSVDIDAGAQRDLAAAGCRLQPIPQAGKLVPFEGDEFVISPSAYGIFDALRAEGRIVFGAAEVD
jgi:hypothetical protein